MEEMRDDSKDDAWDKALHQQISPFVKLYSQMTLFSQNMIVAHRNMISIYNLGITQEIKESLENSSAWTDTVKVSNSADHVRQMMIK